MRLSDEDRRRYEEWRERNKVTTFVSEIDRIKYMQHRRLYDRYAKEFEERFRGQYIAIGWDGRVVIGEHDGEVLRRAAELMGRGFGILLARLGYDVTYEWGE